MLRFAPLAWGPSPRRLLLAVALLGVAAAGLAAGGASAADDPVVTVQLQAGYSGTAPPGGWAPVQVGVTNNGPDLRATVALTVGLGSASYSGPGRPLAVPSFPGSGMMPLPAIIGKGPGQAPWESPVTQKLDAVLPSGTTKHFTAYLPSMPGTVRAEVLDAKRAPAKSLARVETQLSAPSGMAVAVVSDNPAALGQVGAISTLAATFGGQPQLVHLTPGGVPDSPQALASFPVVVIDDATTDSFTSSQRAALDDYVAEGGSILVTGGAAWQKTLAGLPADLVLLAPTTTQSLPGLPLLSASLGAAPLTGNVDVAVGARRAGVTDLAEGSVPILVEARRGRGRVLYAAIDPSAEPLASWSGAVPLLRQALVRAATADFPNGTSYGPTVGLARDVQLQAGALYQALSNIPSLDLPSPALIALVLVVFILLVGPANYFALRRLRRPDLAWATIPLLVVLSGVGIYGIGLKTKGTDLLADRIRLLNLQNRDGKALVASGTGVFSPHTGTHTVATTTGSLVAPLLGGWAVPLGNVSVNSGGSGQGPDPLTIEGDPPTVRMSWANPDSIQAFGEQYTEKESGSLQEHLTVVGGRITGTVTNRLPVTLTDAAVIYGTNFVTFGPIRPGGSVTVNIALPTVGSNGGSNGGPGSGGPVSTLPDQIYLHTPAQCSGPPCGSGWFGYTPGTSRPTARQREAQRRSQVLSGVLGPNVAYVPQPLFVAWAQTLAGSVRIDGRRARLNQLDGLFLPLQPETGAVLPAGVVRARPIDTNGTAFGLGATYGAPTFLPPNNQVNYEFSLPGGGPGAVPGAGSGPAWQELALTATKPTAPPGFVSTTPTYGVFNFRTSTWDPITLTFGQAVPIPSPADHVSPDGAVRVRMQAGAGGLQFSPVIDISGERAPDKAGAA